MINQERLTALLPELRPFLGGAKLVYMPSPKGAQGFSLRHPEGGLLHIYCTHPEIPLINGTPKAIEFFRGAMTRAGWPLAV